MDGAMTKLSLLLPVSALVVLGGCVTVPVGPAVRVMPGTGKSFEQFQADDGNCRQYAYNAIGGPNAVQPGQNAAAADAAWATALGAAAGAALGAWSGNAGYGAAWGAGTGLLFGSAAGANTAGYSSYSSSTATTNAYMQCMYSRGNQVPGRLAYRSSMPVYSYPSQSYPQVGNPVPPGVPESVPPQNYPQNYPPPNTPPPRS
jgi:hypothetical protein